MRAYSRNQFAELDFDGKEYEFNEQEGTFAGIITLGFTMIVNKMLSKKMANIDMLGALKSVE